MKDIAKILLLVLPMLKDLIGSIGHEADTAKKQRIIRILQDKDLTKLERLSRILGLTVKDAAIIGYTPQGIEVNESFVMEYYRMQRELRDAD